MNNMSHRTKVCSLALVFGLVQLVIAHAAYAQTKKPYPNQPLGFGISARSNQATTSAQPLPKLLKVLTGDNIVIDADWSAHTTDGTYKFEPVRDGNPSKPHVSAHRGVTSNHSIAFQVPTDQSGHKERIEYKIARAVDADGLHFDNARYSRFSFQVATPTAPFKGSAIIYQCWQGYPYGPPVSLKIEAGVNPPYKLKLAVRNMLTGPNSTTPDLEVWSKPMIQPNTWYKVIVYVEPRYDTNGRISLWVNGDQYANWSGKIGYDPSQVIGAYEGLDIKNGIYQPGVNNGHTIYFDQIMFGTDFNSMAR